MQCLYLPENRFVVLWILFAPGYSESREWIHLIFQHCPYLGAVCIVVQTL